MSTRSILPNWFQKFPLWGKVATIAGIAPALILYFVIFSLVFGSNQSNSSSSASPSVAGVVSSSSSDPKLAELENKLKEEETKRQEAEKSKEELESKIAQSQKINYEYDVESDLESQLVEVAQQANLAIASLGESTKDKKLFDVTSVVDGDTIKVSELGTLRLIGIDTPETKDPRKPVQCFGVEASNKAKELLSGKKVYLEFDPANRIDKYGRTLAYVFREDNLFFNAEMVKEGYANSYTKFPHPKLEEFNEYQRQARDQSKGLWSPNTCNGDSTKPAVSPAPVVSSSSSVKSTPPVVSNSKSTKTTVSSSSSKSQTSTVRSSSSKSSAPAPTSGFIAGTCGELKAKGMGNFTPGDPNYTKARDRDGDGIACEL